MQCKDCEGPCRRVIVERFMGRIPVWECEECGSAVSTGEPIEPIKRRPGETVRKT